MIDKAAVLSAFDTLKAVVTVGTTTVSGEDISRLVDAIGVLHKWTAAYKAVLDGAQAPAKITQREVPSGLMVDKDTPGPSFLEYYAEYQAP